MRVEVGVSLDCMLEFVIFNIDLYYGLNIYGHQYYKLTVSLYAEYKSIQNLSIPFLRGLIFF